MAFDLQTAKLKLAWLYPEYLNLYGDRGNVLALFKRAKWRGLALEICPLSIGDEFVASNYDLVFIGGGQDQEQASLHKDLVEKKASALKEYILNDGVLLAICGGYQLLGQYYKTAEGKLTQGIGILPVYTEAQSKRLIGNLEFVASNLPLQQEEQHLFGFENHSGLTYFAEKTEFEQALNDNKQSEELAQKYAFGKVVKGCGNNGTDNYEGCHFKNSFGTYAHGSFLPKNPAFADYLLTLALRKKYHLPADYHLPELKEDLLSELRDDLRQCEV